MHHLREHDKFLFQFLYQVVVTVDRCGLKPKEPRQLLEWSHTVIQRKSGSSFRDETLEAPSRPTACVQYCMYVH